MAKTAFKKQQLKTLEQRLWDAAGALLDTFPILAQIGRLG